MSDRLEIIRQKPHGEDVQWLIEEVERLRGYVLRLRAALTHFSGTPEFIEEYRATIERIRQGDD